MKKVIAIVGPTASGKTKLSIKVAKAIHGEIINGDSVQVYQGLDIGSAKITRDEMEGINHHLINQVRVGETYSVFDFQKDARALIDVIDYPVIVGGTGLYIKATLYDYEFVDKGRSIAFEERYEPISNEMLYQMLLKKDPEIKIDSNNRRRLLRALEQAEAGEYRSKKTNKDKLLYDVLIIYLDLDRKVLEERLRHRLEQQIRLGFIDEVKNLVDQDVMINAIGYKEITQYLSNEISLEDAKELIITHSKQLAKKQKTWFKNQMNPRMFNALDENLVNQVISEVKVFLEEGNA